MAIEEVINTYVVEDEQKTQREIARKLADNFSLLQIVMSLGDPLTQEDGLVRAKATQCLADVIFSLEKLTAQEITVLTVFLSDRLSDIQSVENAADGLRWIVRKGDSKLITTDDFWNKLRNVDMLNLNVEARFKIFQLLDDLSQQDMSVALASVFVSLAGGEKDPRNLMLTLAISRRVLESLGSSLNADKRAEVYDITFCYFPVKFHPPKDMPYKITAEEIKANLMSTLSRPEIAEWVIPGLIAKLTAVNVQVKLDSLKFLDAAVTNVVKSGESGLYWRQVWDGIKFEVLHGTSENDTYKPVIEILRKFVDIPEFISDIKQELAVENIPKSKLHQLSQLVIGISSTEDTWRQLAPYAIEKVLDQPSDLKLFLNTEYRVPQPDLVFQALLQAIANDHKKDAIDGLKRLANNPEGVDFVPLIVQTLTQEKAYAELAELAATHPNAIRDHVLPHLLNELPNTLEPLSDICRVRSLVHVFAVRLLSRLDFRDQVSSLNMLRALITASGHLNAPTDFIGFDRVLGLPLLRKLAESKATKLNDVIINSICVLMERTSRGVPAEYQSTYVSHVLKYLGEIHFHVILSSVAAMETFPFEPDFINAFVLPRLRDSKDVLERAGYLRLVALTANKWPKEGVPVDSLESTLEEVAQKREKRDYSTVEVLAWVIKGLVLRADNAGFSNTLGFCRLAKDDMTMATIFGAIVATDRLLAKENGCTVRQLFRQRLFTMILPEITVDETSMETLMILSSLLKYTPQQVVAAKFDAVLQMLMSSLTSKIPVLQETAVQSIFSSLPSSARTLEPHLYEMVPRLLEIATSMGSTSSARLGSLQVIIALRDVLPSEMGSFGEMVINGLVPALSDPRRSLRKHAVKCRQVFY